MTKKEALEAFGSVKALALALGITEGAVSQWGEELPPLRVFQLQEILRNQETQK
jgi:DNA-binding transcriptional regulator YdaS (Cro superfamily)